MNKKAISGVVATVIMIALVIAIAGVVWVVVSNLVSEELEEAGTCLDVLGKVTINPQYTCYNSSEKHLQVSVGVGDIVQVSVIVGVTVSVTVGVTVSVASAKDAGIMNISRKNRFFFILINLLEI